MWIVTYMHSLQNKSTPRKERNSYKLLAKNKTKQSKKVTIRENILD